MSTTPPVPLEATDICEAFARTVQQHADELALRCSDGSVELTWADFDTAVRAAAAGLAHLGVGRGATVAMLLTNRWEAAVVDMATLHLAAVPTSLYNNASIQQIAFVLEDCGANVVVTERALVERMRGALAILSTSLKLVVVDGDQSADVGSLDALCSSGAPLSAGSPIPATKDDLITLVYTSGTTGQPKGAELNHQGILSQLRGFDELLNIPMGGRVISYLPFAHLADRLVSYYMPILSASCITYHGDPRTVIELLPEVNPTLFIAVPRIWQKIETSARARIAERPEGERATLLQAVELGSQIHDLRALGRDPDPDLVARWKALDPSLRALRTELGLDAGELILTGTAALPAECLRFFAAIGIDLCECFGQTESGTVTGNPAGRARPGTIGIELPGVSAKLAEDGELLVKGPQVMVGYRGQPELAAAAFDADGWLKTGDLCTVDDDGYYRIVGRKKEIFVSLQGENVAPTLVENTVSQASPLCGVVCAFGDGRPYVTALIAPDPDAAAVLTGARDPQANAVDPRVVDELSRAVAKANQQLGRAEQIKRFQVLKQPWVPGSEELTPTMKLRRANIDRHHAALIETLYGPGSDGVLEPRQG
jgi:long-subunit acyl-CoA synthetase (AMP-forming)